MLRKFKRWLLKKLIYDRIQQGYFQTQKLIELYKLIREIIDTTFHEDNIPTLDYYCMSCFIKSQKGDKYEIEK